MVSAVGIDAYVDRARVPRIDLVKIDVEGAEPGVLDDMARTLLAWHPDVLVEATSESAWRNVRARFPRDYRCYPIDERRGITNPGLGPLTRRRLRRRGCRNYLFSVHRQRAFVSL